MKRFSLLLLLFVFILFLPGCSEGKRDVEEATATAKAFFEAFYRVDDFTAETTMEVLERCKPYLTEEANTLFLQNRETAVIYELARLEKANISVDKIDLTVVESDRTDDKIPFDFLVEIKLVSPDDATENIITLNGYLEIKKEDGSWKVSYILGHRPRLDV